MKKARKRELSESIEETHSEPASPEANALRTQGMFSNPPRQEAVQLQISPLLTTLLFNIYVELKRRNDMEEQKRKEQEMRKEAELKAEEEAEAKDKERFAQIAPSLYM